MSLSLSEPPALPVSGTREISVGRVEDFVENDVIQLVIGQRFIALYRLAGEEFHATDDVCTHGQAFLSDGYLTDDCLIECPLHGGCFEIRTGKAVEEPAEIDLPTFVVRVDNGEVLLTLPDD